ncbi:serine-enriched protein-like [Gigantopelta aegis]|uniref:serine-enriched protein-like n=1 Tax=Gigantopelta aegis TaxID=1735272 RepID=UPI001B88BDB1|nr:serine-enriched protein-like [Gigantopelta aegis]
MCDVTFLVGKDKTPVYGLKSVIAARSSVLCDLILNRQRQYYTGKSSSSRASKMWKFLRFDKKKKPAKAKIGRMSTSTKLEIPVSHFDENVFRKLVFFLHLGHVTVTQDTLIGLLCAASEFKVADLSRACWEFLDRSLSLGHLTGIVQPAEQYRKHPAYQSITEKVQSSERSQKST